MVRSPSETREPFSEVIFHHIDSASRLPLVRCLAYVSHGFPYETASHPNELFQSFADFIYSSLPLVFSLGGTGILHLFPIAYAFLPRLRDRLTQGRRALPWKPWAFGEGDFHSFYRVLMPCIITSMRSNTPYGISSPHILRSPTAYLSSK